MLLTPQNCINQKCDPLRPTPTLEWVMQTLCTDFTYRPAWGSLYFCSLHLWFKVILWTKGLTKGKMWFYPLVVIQRQYRIYVVCMYMCAVLCISMCVCILEKTLMLGKIEGRRRGDGQGNLVCCSSRGCSLTWLSDWTDTYIYFICPLKNSNKILPKLSHHS